MKQKVSMPTVVAVTLVVLLIVGIVGWRTMSGPSVADAPASGKAPPPPTSGPTPEQIREMNEYNAARRGGAGN